MSRVQDDPNRRCLKVQEWPPTDRALWQRILVTGNPFEENGAAAHWRKDTCHKNRKGYGRWLTFLSNHGIPLSDEPPGDRVALKNVRAYLDELVRHEVSTYTRRNRLLELYAVISAMHPDRDWQWLREAAARVERAGAPKTAKRERIISTQKILHSGLALMEEARSMAETDQRYWKARYRDGLMISLLALRPLRRRNFAAIEIGRHLVVMTGGLTLVFDAEETKTHVTLEFSVPDCLNVPLTYYIDHVRPDLLQGQRTKRLWISERGKPMSAQAVYHRITKVTARVLGRPLNPHLFRDCLATTWAEEDPRHSRGAAALLGHRSFRTTERHYLHAEARRASRSYVSAIASLRRQLR